MRLGRRGWVLASLLVAMVIAVSAYIPAGAKVKIIYWHGWGGEEKQVLDEVVAEFNRANPDIEVEAVTIFGSYDKLLTAIAAGSPPDVTSAVWWYQVPELASRGALLPLDAFAKGSQLDASAYVKPVWDAVHYNGRLYAMPVLANYSMIAYNKDHFAQAGLPDRGPSTIGELTEWAHKLSQVNRGRITRLGYLPNDLFLAIPSFGGQIWDPERGTLTPMDPGVVAAAKWMKEFYDTYGYVAVRSFEASFGNYASPDNPFFSGKLSMQNNWGEWIVNFSKWYAPEFNYGRFAYPTEDGSPGFINWGGSVWAIPVGAKHPAEAWRFIQWLSAGEGGKMLALRISNASARLEVNESPEFLAAMPVLKDALPFLREGRLVSTPPVFPGVEEFVQRLTPVLDRVLSGEIGVEAALAELSR